MNRGSTMKKQQKRKKKSKNRSSSRQRPRQQRPHRAHQSAGRVLESPGDILLAACVASDALTAVGLPVDAGAVLVSALTTSVGPGVRSSEPYRHAEARLLSLTANMALHSNDAVAWEWLFECLDSKLSRRLRLHIIIALAEGHLEGVNLRQLDSSSEELLQGVLPLDGSNRGGEVALRNVIANRRFELGDLRGAEHEWRLVGELLSRKHVLDAGAARLLAANMALSQWRSGNAPGAAAILADAIRDNPVMSEQDVRSAYPVVCLAELLRSIGDTAAAQAAIATVEDMYPPLESLLEEGCGGHVDGMAEDEIEFVRRGIDELGTVIAVHRTYHPPQTRLGLSSLSADNAGGAHGTYGGGVEMYGSALGIQAVDWCSPRELLMLHGPDDYLFLLSTRMTALSAMRGTSVVAVRELRDVRRVLDAEYPASPLSEEIGRAEKAGLALIAAAGRL